MSPLSAVPKKMQARGVPVVVAAVLLAACGGNAAAPEKAPREVLATAPLTEKQQLRAAEAMRELLALAIADGVARKSRPGGFVKTGSVHIGVPDALREIADVVEADGGQALVDDFVVDMNVTAEIVSAKVKPYFDAYLANMQIGNDVMITLHGDDTAAMREFRRQSEAQLLDALTPYIREAQRRSGAYDSYDALINAYFRHPGAVRLPFDEELYLRGKIADGLFTAIGESEGALRRDPGERASKNLRGFLGR